MSARWICDDGFETITVDSLSSSKTVAILMLDLGLIGVTAWLLMGQ